MALNRLLTKRKQTSTSKCNKYGRVMTIRANNLFAAPQGEITLTLHHEQPTNLLMLTIHRVNFFNKYIGRHIFVKVYLMPGKSQKKKSRSVKTTNDTEFDKLFTFKNLTIHQLETSSVKIDVYLKKGWFRPCRVIANSQLALKDVNLEEFDLINIPIHNVFH